MQIMHYFASGLLSVIKVTAAPMLYRYPYRTSAEGLRADWLNIGKDINNMAERLGSDDEQ